jgi:hypothetical protein
VKLYNNSFQHGGISLEEMIVPFITMETKWGRFEICDLWFVTWDLWFVIWDLRFVIWDLWFETCDLWFVIWDLRFEIWDLRFEIWDLRFEIWDLPCRGKILLASLAGLIAFNAVLFKYSLHTGYKQHPSHNKCRP